MRHNVSHLRDAGVEERAALLVASFRAAQDVVGTASFPRHASLLVARLVAETRAPIVHARLDHSTFYARHQGGYAIVSLYPGRVTAAACRQRTRIGDHGLLGPDPQGPRVDQRLLRESLRPGPRSVWALLTGPVADLAAQALRDPSSHPQIVESAARLAVPERPTSIPLDALRGRTKSGLSLGETLARFLVAHGYSQAEAARELGMKDAAQVRTLLRRADAKGGREAP